MSEKEKFYGAGMQKRRCVTPNRKKKLWIQSLKVREATTGSNWLQFCCRQGDAYQRTGGKACATALGILRPTSAMVQQSLGHGENQRPPPSNVKKATMATTQLSKFSESLGYTPFEIQPVLPFLWRACLRHRQRHLRCVQAALLLRQRRASSWTLSVISFHQFTI